MYADVIIDISHEQLDKTFQYAVPDELVDVIELGMSVDIPFGAGNRQITGYVVGLGDKAAYPVEKIKYITGITEGKVTAVSRMLKLAAWLKHNYGCTMNQAIKTVIPVKDKVKQKEKHSVNLIIDAAQAQKYLDTFAKKNAKARYRLLEALIKEPVIDESIIKSKLNITAQTVKAFEDMGIAEVRSEDMYRNPVRNVTGYVGAVVAADRNILEVAVGRNFSRAVEERHRKIGQRSLLDGGPDIVDRQIAIGAEYVGGIFHRSCRRADLAFFGVERSRNGRESHFHFRWL